MRVKIFTQSHASPHHAAESVENELNAFLDELAKQNAKVMEVQLSTSVNEKKGTVSAMVCYND